MRHQQVGVSEFGVDRFKEGVEVRHGEPPEVQKKQRSSAELVAPAGDECA
jgi:hypothetical protein